MIWYMGHGLKLPQLACMRHPAHPTPPSFIGIVAQVCPIRLCHRLNGPVGSMRPCGLFVKVQGCLPERLSAFHPYPRKSARILPTFLPFP